MAASIEPHSYECGNWPYLAKTSASVGASIEPHSYECGNDLAGVSVLTLSELQLSHIHMNVETIIMEAQDPNAAE